MSLLVIVGLFLLGAVNDWLSSAYIKVAAEGRYRWASLLSVVHTLFSYGVFFGLAEELMGGRVSSIIAYAIGGGAGTWFSLKPKA